MVLPLTIHIEQQHTNGIYPVFATIPRGDIHTELQLSEQITQRAMELMLNDATPTHHNSAALGRHLSESLFTPPLYDLLMRSVYSAARRQARVQIRLHIQPPELRPLPWEWMRLGENGEWLPAIRDDYTLVRVGLQKPVPPLTLELPLQILALAPQGDEAHLSVLSETLGPLIRAGQINLTIMLDPTPATLEQALVASPVHVLHCAASVQQVAANVPVLCLGDAITAPELARQIRSAMHLRMVTLAGSVSTSGTIAVGPSSFANQLLEAGVPGVISFGTGIAPETSAQFAEVCYKHMLAGEDVDLAVSAGRAKIADEWYVGPMPSLLLPPDGERLFAVRSTPTKRSWFRRGSDS